MVYISGQFAAKEFFKKGEIHDLVAITMGLRSQSLNAIQKGFDSGQWRFLLIARNTGAGLEVADWDQDRYGETFNSWTYAVVDRGKMDHKPKYEDVFRTELWEDRPDENGLRLVSILPVYPYQEAEVEYLEINYIVYFEDGSSVSERGFIKELSEKYPHAIDIREA